MVVIRRTLYLLYYLRETDFRQIKAFRRYASALTGRSLMKLTIDSILSVYRYNISIKDYYCFRFFELAPAERKRWAGTGYMYEYQLKMNPRGSREVLENKILFLKYFKKFVNRSHSSLKEMELNPEIAGKLLDNATGKLVLKGSHGQVGAEVKIIESGRFRPDTLLEYMRINNFNLAEEYVIQHPSLMELSPTALNTIRIFTQLNNGVVEFLGARLRISVNSQVDNMAAGNLAAPVDLESGVVSGPGIFSDITKQYKAVHPITEKTIMGFHVPNWNAVIELARNAALVSQENKSVGWDIAITPTGPELIEGNHNWCKLLWQMPVRQGLKPMLDRYLDEGMKREMRDER